MTTKRRIGSWLALLLCFGALGWAWFNRVAVEDWFRLAGYTPPAAVSSLSSDDTMTDLGAHLFYINQPQIVAKQAFRDVCTIHEQTIVLGCYHSVQSGIYILSITGDTRLQGVMQVTAAHEMLHAAYDRLSDTERTQVDNWLQEFYRHGLKDKRVKDTIESYKRTEPKDVVNEMHSVFATEVKTLPPQLENYYKRYFQSRDRVTGFAAKYQSSFTERERLVAAYDKQLKSQKNLIDEHKTLLGKQAAQISRKQAELNGLRAAGKIDEYNAGVSGYNQQVRTYNALIDETRAEISAYNALVAKRNAVALETQQLTSELRGNDFSTINN
jgi:hypothetical protein